MAVVAAMLVRSLRYSVCCAHQFLKTQSTMLEGRQGLLRFIIHS